MNISENIKKLKKSLPGYVTLVAISKTKPVSDLMEAYQAGQRVFGENKIQEMVDKWQKMPEDVNWHMVGHVQTNKVKYIAEFVDLIHAVDSLKLLKEINKQAKKHNRILSCLLQIKIAQEDSKFGMTQENALEILNSEEFKGLQNVSIQGLMGMATFTRDEEQLSKEFKKLKTFFDELKVTRPNIKTLSMGMSGDYPLAIEYGSTMIRVGSSIFGERNY